LKDYKLPPHVRDVTSERCITALHLERFYTDLAKLPGRGKLLSNRSIHHVHALLRNALADAQRFRLVSENATANASADPDRSDGAGFSPRHHDA